MLKQDKLPLSLVPETRADYFRFVLHRLWMQNVICDHKYKIQKIEWEPASELWGTREHYLETWQCEYCGRLYRRSHE